MSYWSVKVTHMSTSYCRYPVRMWGLRLNDRPIAVESLVDGWVSRVISSNSAGAGGAANVLDISGRRHLASLAASVISAAIKLRFTKMTKESFVIS